VTLGPFDAHDCQAINADCVASIARLSAAAPQADLRCRPISSLRRRSIRSCRPDTPRQRNASPIDAGQIRRARQPATQAGPPIRYDPITWLPNSCAVARGRFQRDHWSKRPRGGRKQGSWMFDPSAIHRKLRPMRVDGDLQAHQEARTPLVLATCATRARSPHAQGRICGCPPSGLRSMRHVLRSVAETSTWPVKWRWLEIAVST